MNSMGAESRGATWKGAILYMDTKMEPERVPYRRMPIGTFRMRCHLALFGVSVRRQGLGTPNSFVYMNFLVGK
jgi:hypothetical protein